MRAGHVIVGTEILESNVFSVSEDCGVWMERTVMDFSLKEGEC